MKSNIAKGVVRQIEDFERSPASRWTALQRLRLGAAIGSFLIPKPDVLEARQIYHEQRARELDGDIYDFQGEPGSLALIKVSLAERLQERHLRLAERRADDIMKLQNQPL